MLEIPADIPMLLLMTVPLFDIAVAVVLLIKKEKCVKNAVVGILAAIVILTVGTNDSIEFDAGEGEEAAYTYLESVNTLLGTDLPRGNNATFYIYDNVEEGSGRAKSEFYATLTAEEYSALIEKTKADTKFKTAYPSTHMGILPVYYRDNDASLALVYNKTTGEFNTVPAEDGTYEMYFVYVYEYVDGSAGYNVIEYDLEYTSVFPE